MKHARSVYGCGLKVITKEQLLNHCPGIPAFVDYTRSEIPSRVPCKMAELFSNQYKYVLSYSLNNKK